jgi:tetratricopeptide (TPR) repeat protein
MNQKLSTRELQKLSLTDEKLIQYAKGWLELGLPLEASDELDRISAGLRAHPDVLMVRYVVYAALQKWEMAAEIAHTICTMLPEEPAGFIHLACSLHELKRTKEARDVLLPIAHKFPNNPTIPYHLACYFCRLGDKRAALQWLTRAIDLTNSAEVKLQALDDPDLQDLLTDISSI